MTKVKIPCPKCRTQVSGEFSITGSTYDKKSGDSIVLNVINYTPEDTFMINSVDLKLDITCPDCGRYICHTYTDPIFWNIIGP